MPAKPLVVGTNQFKSQSEATRFFQKILSRYLIGQFVDEQDKSDLKALVALHPRSNELLSRPICEFRVNKSNYYANARDFDIIYEDGTSGSFSYLKCISPPKDPHRQNVLLAMRCEVLIQTRHFHRTAFAGKSKVLCAITGLPTKANQSHVDHMPPLTFQALVLEFLKDAQIAIEEIEISDDGLLQREFKDRNLATRWQAFHAKHSHLRVVSKFAHSKANKSRTNLDSVNKKTQLDLF